MRRPSPAPSWRSFALALALGASLGCGHMFDFWIGTLELYGRLNPFHRCAMIDSLPGGIYLPRTMLGREPDLAISYVTPGESIGFVQDLQTRSGGVTETLRVWIGEGAAESMSPNHLMCLLGQGPPQMCQAIATTPLGRRVFPHYLLHPATGFVFAIDRTVIAVSVGRHDSTNPALPWNRVALSTAEVEAFVDSFVAAGRWELCWMPLRESQDVE